METVLIRWSWNMSELQPGRELDALIAEKVMGEKGSIEDLKLWVPRYSVSIEAAWEVVEKFRLCVWPTNKRRWFAWKNEFDESYGDEYWFGGDEMEETVERFNGAVSNSAPHAICLAALKACELTEKQR